MIEKLLLLFCCLLSITVRAQTGVGEGVVERPNPGRLSQKDYADLKATTTLFVYRESDKPKLDQWKDALKDVWTFTPLQFIPFSDLNQYTGKTGYSYFILSPVTLYGSGTTIYFPFTLMRIKEGNGKPKMVVRIDMGTDLNTHNELAKMKDDKAMAYLNGSANLVNWYPGFIRNYLKNVNDLLVANTPRGVSDEVKQADELKRLATDTLFIPESVLDLDRAGNYTKEEIAANASKVMKEYPYPYKVIDTEALSQKILATREPFYYLMFVNSAIDHFCTVFNASTSLQVYSEYGHGDIDRSTLRSLAKAVAAATK